MNRLRIPGMLAGCLVLAIVLAVLTVVLQPPAAADGPSHVYLPEVLRWVATATPTPTVTPTPTSTPTVTCSAIPTLLYPPDKATLDTLIPEFRWTTAADPNVTRVDLLVLSDDGLHTGQGWSTEYGLSGPDSELFDDNFDPATGYHWEMWVSCGGVQGTHSPVRSFITGSGGTFPGTAALLSPADGTVLSGTSLTAQWAAVGGAQGYTLNLSGGSYTHAWSHTTLTQKTWSRLKPSTAYSWWVVARNAYAWGADSAQWHFTTGAAGEMSATWPDPFDSAVRPGRAYFSRASDGSVIESSLP